MAQGVEDRARMLAVLSEGRGGGCRGPREIACGPLFPSARGVEIAGLSMRALSTAVARGCTYDRPILGTDGQRGRI